MGYIFICKKCGDIKSIDWKVGTRHLTCNKCAEPMDWSNAFPPQSVIDFRNTVDSLFKLSKEHDKENLDTHYDFLKNHFDKLKDSGFTVIIFSNSPRNRLEPFKKYLNIDCCPSARKPRKAKFIKVLKEYKLDLSEVAIIGDQLVTDIYGGNRVGITTVLVNPMSDIDMTFTKLHRYIERKELNKMNKKGIFKVGEYYD